jgi:two-component system, NarL family, response regulator NreC
MRILLCDDHRILREGLKSLIERQPDMEVVAEAENGREIIQLAQELSPDIIIMDVSMPDMNGIEATRKIIAESPSARVLALSVHTNRRFITEMLRAGASGYVLKECAFEELVKAIHAVFNGHIYLCNAINDLVVRDYLNKLKDGTPVLREGFQAFSILTEREREVLQLLAEGKTTKDIAFSLQVSIKTIEAFRHNLMNKLGIYSIAGLTKFAIVEGLTALQ